MSGGSTPPEQFEKLMKYTLIPLAAVVLFSASCSKQESAEARAPSANAVIPYSLDTCLVSGEKLGSMGDPVVIQHEGHEIKFCCDSCVPKFKKEPASYLEKLEHSSHSH
mgnify:CR=1 FL=1